MARYRKGHGKLAIAGLVLCLVLVGRLCVLISSSRDAWAGVVVVSEGLVAVPEPLASRAVGYASKPAPADFASFVLSRIGVYEVESENSGRGVVVGPPCAVCANTLVAVLVTSAYLDMFELWLVYARRHRWKFAAVVLDDKSARAVEALAPGTSVMLPLANGRAGRGKVLQAKLVLFRAVLRLRVSLFFMDVDLLPFRDPVPLLDQGPVCAMKFQVDNSEDCHGEELSPCERTEANTGFVFFRHPQSYLQESHPQSERRSDAQAAADLDELLLRASDSAQRWGHDDQDALKGLLQREPRLAEPADIAFAQNTTCFVDGGEETSERCREKQAHLTFCFFDPAAVVVGSERCAQDGRYVHHFNYETDHGTKLKQMRQCATV